MKLKIITPDKTLFDGNINYINIAQSDGAFSILDGHAPLITVVKDVVSTIQTDDGQLSYISFNSGTLKVLNNEVSLIVDYGIVGTSKEEAKINFANLREEIKQNNGSLGDDTIVNFEMELMKRMKEMSK